jgi:hypothetical protein
VFTEPLHSSGPSPGFAIPASRRYVTVHSPTHIHIERRNRVGRNSASYSQSPGFRSLPGDLLSLIEVFSWFYTVPLGKFRHITIYLLTHIFNLI